METVICPWCKTEVFKKNYCNECGYPLKDFDFSHSEDSHSASPKNSFIGEKFSNQSEQGPQRRALSEKGLTLLVNVCKKTVGTVGGGGYSETVLYLDETSGEYSVHTFSRYSNMKEESHLSYKATRELADSVMKYINTNNLALLINNHGIGLCGGDYIIRFKNNNEWIRLDSGNLNGNLSYYFELNSMLNSCVTENNRCFCSESGEKNE